MADQVYRPEQCKVVPLPAEPEAWRLEIDEFMSDPAMTNLLLLSLAKMQDTSNIKNGKEENWLSFYNLASIHGNPKERWNNVVVPNENLQSNEGYWYCAHASVIFPPFHRAYIMAFENELVRTAEDIASKYQDAELRAWYENAAKRLRLPFWDPFMPRRAQVGEDPTSVWGIPEIFKAETVWVRDPSDPSHGGKQIRNPLYEFKFPDRRVLANSKRTGLDVQESFGVNRDDVRVEVPRNSGKLVDRTYRIPRKISPLANTYTLRAPNQDGDTSYLFLDTAIQSQGKVASSKVWQLLRDDETTNARTWDRFSNHNFSAKDPEKLFSERMGVSLESWHDDIHVLTGSALVHPDQNTLSAYPGHMSSVGVAAFDPIFWFHHNNIERYFAIYQAIWPEKYVPDVSTPDGINSSTWLRPFTNGNNQELTSKDMRDYKITRFAVPGVDDLTKQGKEELDRYLYATYYWATLGASPPAGSWPKDMSKSYAIHGPDAKLPKKDLLEFESLEKQSDGQFKLVYRSLDVSFKKSKAEPIPFNDEVPHHISVKPEEDFSRKFSNRVWNAYFLVDKYAFDGSFSIHFFIGKVGKDTVPAGYMLQDNEIGYSGIFAALQDDACTRCKTNQNNEMKYEDVVPLTPGLEDYLVSSRSRNVDQSLKTLPDLEPEHVVPFLKKNLAWRIITAGGLQISPERVADHLTIGVYDRKYTLPSEDVKLGRYGPATLHTEITQGKPGGASGEFATT